MARDKNGDEWFYPHGKPVEEYSFTSAFANDAELHGMAAEKNVMAMKSRAGGGLSPRGRGGKAIAELNRMIGMARGAEQNFLMAHGLKNPGNNWSKLITGINEILGTKASFERNLQIIKQVASGDSKEYRDIDEFFRGKLQSAIYESLKVDVNKSAYEILEIAVRSAIKKMGNITDTINEQGLIENRVPKKGEKSLQAFAEMFQLVQKILNTDILLQVDNLFDLTNYIEQARQDILYNQTTKGEKRSQKELTYAGQGNKGTLAELLRNIVAQGIGSGYGDGLSWRTVENTGGFNYKPDNVLATMEISYNRAAQKVKDNKLVEGNSRRRKGIATMEELYKQVGDAKGHIVLVSDKSYVIDSAFISRGGFEAQGSTSLNALQGLFSSLHITGFDVEALINYLANVGGGMIEQQADEHILKMIATQIGNFLFDDLSFESTPINANVVHVFNLSGIYVPLSIVLEGVKRGVGGLQNTDLSSYVEVNFRASGDKPDPWRKDEAPWIAFRNAKMSNNTLNVHFLKDFASIIAEAVSI